MNKNLKVISSLAMAGILAATGLSSVSNAATTKSLGVYRKLVDGKIVVPYELGSSNDTLTAKNVKDDNGNITISLSDGSTVKTGTKFRKSGEEHTVIIYGDVEADGSVNVNDVTATAKAVFKTPTDKFVKEAADVEHDGSINVNDVTKLAKFIVKKQPLNVKLTPEKQDENEYTLAVNENNVVNNVNGAALVDGEGGTTITITPKSGTFTGEEEFTAKIYQKQADGTYATAATKTIADLTAKANEKYIVVENVDLHEITLVDDADHAGENDGTYKLQLLDAESNVVGEVEFEINTDVSKMNANVAARRAGDTEAVVSIESPADAKIEKIYITVPGKDKVEVPVNNGVGSIYLDADDGITTAAQTITYELVNDLGNVVSGSVKLISNEADDAALTISGITAQTAKNAFDITFSATAEAAETVAVTLYKDGKVIATAEKDVAEDAEKVEADFTTEIEAAGVGTYTIKAYVKANGTTDTKQSDTVDSATTAKNKGKIIISKLSNIAGKVKVDLDKANPSNSKISWTDTAHENMEGITYGVEFLYPEYIDEEYTGNYVTATDENMNSEVDAVEVTLDADDQESKTVALPTIADNTAYKVQVVAKSADARMLDSDPIVSDEFFNLVAPTIGATTQLEESVKLSQITKIDFVGKKTVTYDVEVGAYTDNDITTTVRKNVTLTKTTPARVVDGNEVVEYETVIDHLEAGKTYRFALIANVGNVSDKSTVTAGVDIPQAAEKITGLVVNSENAEGNIFVDDTKAYIDGKEYLLTDFSTEYASILTGIVKELSTGDKITVSGNNIKVELLHEEQTTLDLGAAIEGKTIELVGNTYRRTITTAAKAEKITLTSGRFAIGEDAALTANSVVLNGTDLKSEVALTTTTGRYTVVANKNNTINGITVNAKKNIVVGSAAVEEITTIASDSAVTLSSKADLAVTVLGEGANVQYQTGAITVENTGDVAFTATNAIVDAAVNVIITDGTLTGLDNEAFAKAQTVTVTNTAKVLSTADDGTETKQKTIITAKLQTPAPFTTKEDETAVAKQYDATKQADKDALTAVVDLAEGKEIEDVINFINALGFVEGNEATVTITDSNVITIEIAGKVTSKVIPGLQK